MNVSQFYLHPTNVETWKAFQKKRHAPPPKILISHYFEQGQARTLIRQTTLTSKEERIAFGSGGSGNRFMLITDEHGHAIEDISPIQLHLHWNGTDIFVRSEKGARLSYHRETFGQPIDSEKMQTIISGEPIYLHEHHYISIRSIKANRPVFPRFILLSSPNPTQMTPFIDTDTLLIWCPNEERLADFQLPRPNQLMELLREENIPHFSTELQLCSWDSLPARGGKLATLSQKPHPNWSLEPRKERSTHGIWCNDALKNTIPETTRRSKRLMAIRQELLANGYDFLMNTDSPHSLYHPRHKKYCSDVFPHILQAEASNKIDTDLLSYLTHGDFHRNKLPTYSEHSLFDDPDAGIWGMTESPHESHQAYTLGKPIHIRDIKEDIRAGAHIAIDFGTSNTVAAKLENGAEELISIALANPSLQEAERTENPTILSFRDSTFLQTWHEVKHRPMVFWHEVASAQDAKSDLLKCLRSLEIKRLSSFLPTLKTWVLQTIENTPPPAQSCVDAKGSPISLRLPQEETENSSSLDPIELYAWQLGLAINHQYQGVYLDYTLGFPITFSPEVQESIRASFERGLYRSLPACLGYDAEVQKEFRVRIGQSEPVSFSSYALDESGIAPTDQGEAFAIFDVGGGTTDFAFGLWRRPKQESEQDYEAILEHHYTSGVQYLGGEIILQELAYLVYQFNIQTCIENDIPFLLPHKQKNLDRAQHLINESFEAKVNSAVLQSKLRGFMEGTEALSSDQSFRISFMNKNREEDALSIIFPVEQLEQHIQKRFRSGVEVFVHSLVVAFGAISPQRIHVFMAGNGSKSRFLENNMSQIDGILAHYFGTPPEIIVHKQKTCKTGTALGQLRLLRGSKIGITHIERSGFSYYIGLEQEGNCTVPIYKGAPNTNLDGDVFVIAQIRAGIATILYTDIDKGESEQGFSELVQSGEVMHKELDFRDVPSNSVLYARIISEDSVQILIGQRGEEVEQDNIVGMLTFTNTDVILKKKS